MPSWGSSGDRNVTLSPRGGKSQRLILPSYLSEPFLPFHIHSRTVARTFVAAQLMLANASLTSQILPANPSQMALPKIPPLCQPPQISTCPVKNVTGSTLSQTKCKLLSLATRALHNSLPRLRSLNSLCLLHGWSPNSRGRPDL